jgi:hypothetical protein|tara:strand:+ start:592 stop:1194 length:603 start_codon:yes stop_codon:yes gene_type:complete
MSKTNSIYKTLSTINVRDKVEKKGGLDYLSWANAWHMLKQNYPNAQRIIYEHDHTGFNFFTDGKTAWVKVGIVVNDIEHIDMLPVMDFRNNAISVDKITSTDVNKTIQRATTKAIAMHGLGLSLWTGEDVPQEEEAPKKKPAPKKKSVKLDDIPADKMEEMLKYVAQNKHLGFKQIVANIEQKYNVNKKQEKQIADALKS